MLLLLLLTYLSPSHAQSSRSSKRGLVYVSTPHSQEDEGQWTRPNSDLTWYYNYSPYIITNYTTLDFVPMLFSIPDAGDTSFTDQVTPLLNSNTITQILAFNEPDGPTSQGGTALSPSDAAKSYIDTLLPLRMQYPGLNLGWPAVTGSPRGLTWLKNFNTSCHKLSPKTGCTADFLPLHWYGTFAGMASYLGQVRAAYPSLPLWVTEFADPDASLDDTESFLNQSLAYLDRLPYVERYCYFGSFRSEDSNVGKEAAMLDTEGGLTDTGAWYLGVQATGKTPESAASRNDLEGSHHWVFGVWAGALLVWILCVGCGSGGWLW
jgi:hypothetical protein